MKPKSQLTKWLLENRAKMNPRFTEFSWPERYFRGLHDFEARIAVPDAEFEGQIIEARGRGIDFDQELALEKASSEAIERLICMFVGVSTEGITVSGCNGANEHAKNEALERYYFYLHEFRHQALQRIKSPEANHLIEQFQDQNQNFELRFYRMATDQSASGIVCAICDEDAGPKFLGIALNADLKTAMTRAMCEALANYARFSDAPKEYKSEVGLDPNAWICAPKFLDEVRHLFTSADVAANSAENLIPEPELKRESVDISKIEVLRGCPIKPVQYRVVGTVASGVVQ